MRGVGWIVAAALGSKAQSWIRNQDRLAAISSRHDASASAGAASRSGLLHRKPSRELFAERGFALAILAVRGPVARIRIHRMAEVLHLLLFDRVSDRPALLGRAFVDQDLGPQAIPRRPSERQRALPPARLPRAEPAIAGRRVGGEPVLARDVDEAVVALGQRHR